ncbi:hypothetical protein [Pollutibacter soli]|uniref:hypothetical protein n=1 Tax=Pollutibacter soli TaxID=3034157 RepID=UPI00301338AC
METLQHAYNLDFPIAAKKESLLSHFIHWAESQEKYRFGWVGGILAAHGCIITPLTLLAVVFGGNNIVFWVAAIVAMGISLIANLAALPTKYTIPVFFFSILIDITVVVLSLATGFGLIS